MNACVHIEDAVRRFLAVAKTIPFHTVFHADDEAHLLLFLIVRHVETVLMSARQDLVLLPSALVLTRTAFETGARILWLLEPEYPFERERRWIAIVREQADYFRRLANRFDRHGGDASKYREAERSIGALADNLESLLTERVPDYPSTRLPKLEKLLESVGRAELYAHYMQLSQFTHGSQVATATYRRGLVPRPVDRCKYTRLKDKIGGRQEQAPST